MAGYFLRLAKRATSSRPAASGFRTGDPAPSEARVPALEADVWVEGAADPDRTAAHAQPDGPSRVAESRNEAEPSVGAREAPPVSASRVSAEKPRPPRPVRRRQLASRDLDGSLRRSSPRDADSSILTDAVAPAVSPHGAPSLRKRGPQASIGHDWPSPPRAPEIEETVSVEDLGVVGRRRDPPAATGQAYPLVAVAEVEQRSPEGRVELRIGTVSVQVHQREKPTAPLPRRPPRVEPNRQTFSASRHYLRIG